MNFLKHKENKNFNIPEKIISELKTAFPIRKFENSLVCYGAQTNLFSEDIFGRIFLIKIPEVTYQLQNGTRSNVE